MPTDAGIARQKPPAAGIVGGYRPWLDGVRAVAVLLVIAQHIMGTIPLELGSLGVGLFFALSGYLITSLLLDERAARGTVFLAGFYLRRAARLVPALLVVVGVCDILFALQGDLGPVRGSIFALTYTANYAQVIRDDIVPGFGPTWTLAVEEHFYVVWPLVLLWATGRFGLRTALRATLVICIAALLWRTLLTQLPAPTLIDLGSVERADALLYGCAAAIALRLGWRPRAWMLWAGVAVIAVWAYGYGRVGNAAPTIGHAVTALASAAVVVTLDYAAPDWARRCLSGRILVRIGILSYGLYLWHGPLMRIARNAGFSGRPERTLVACVAIVVAGASYRYLERPIRTWVRMRTGRPVPRAC